MTSQETTDPYEDTRTRQHWKREKAARVLADWVESGESMTAFTRRHQLSLHRLQWWRAQLAAIAYDHRGSVPMGDAPPPGRLERARRCAVLTEPYIP
jgi:hypothetical protein